MNTLESNLRSELLKARIHAQQFLERIISAEMLLDKLEGRGGPSSTRKGYDVERVETELVKLRKKIPLNPKIKIYGKQN